MKARYKYQNAENLFKYFQPKKVSLWSPMSDYDFDLRCALSVSLTEALDLLTELTICIGGQKELVRNGVDLYKLIKGEKRRIKQMMLESDEPIEILVAEAFPEPLPTAAEESGSVSDESLKDENLGEVTSVEPSIRSSYGSCSPMLRSI